MGGLVLGLYHQKGNPLLAHPPLYIREIVILALTVLDVHVDDRLGPSLPVKAEEVGVDPLGPAEDGTEVGAGDMAGSQGLHRISILLNIVVDVPGPRAEVIRHDVHPYLIQEVKDPRWLHHYPRQDGGDALLLRPSGLSLYLLHQLPEQLRMLLPLHEEPCPHHVEKLPVGEEPWGLLLHLVEAAQKGAVLVVEADAPSEVFLSYLPARVA